VSVVRSETGRSQRKWCACDMKLAPAGCWVSSLVDVIICASSNFFGRVSRIRSGYAVLRSNPRRNGNVDRRTGQEDAYRSTELQDTRD
jgi:hypothetical protein